MVNFMSGSMPLKRTWFRNFKCFKKFRNTKYRNFQKQQLRYASNLFEYECINTYLTKLKRVVKLKVFIILVQLSHTCNILQLTFVRRLVSYYNNYSLSSSNLVNSFKFVIMHLHGNRYIMPND